MAAIFLRGNICKGFEAIGPFEDIEEAIEVCKGEEGWAMTLASMAQPTPEATPVKSDVQDDCG